MNRASILARDCGGKSLLVMNCSANKLVSSIILCRISTPRNNYSKCTGSFLNMSSEQPDIWPNVTLLELEVVKLEVVKLDVVILLELTEV